MRTCLKRLKAGGTTQWGRSGVTPHLTSHAQTLGSNPALKKESGLHFICSPLTSVLGSFPGPCCKGSWSCLLPFRHPSATGSCEESWLPYWEGMEACLSSFTAITSSLAAALGLLWSRAGLLSSFVMARGQHSFSKPLGPFLPCSS